MNEQDHKSQMGTQRHDILCAGYKTLAPATQDIELKGFGNTRPYDRAGVLAMLIPLYASEVAINTREDHAELLAKLQTTLRAECRRGRAGHWTYNVTRHANLQTAYLAELDLFNKNFETATNEVPKNKLPK